MAVLDPVALIPSHPSIHRQGIVFDPGPLIWGEKELDLADRSSSLIEQVLVSSPCPIFMLKLSALPELALYLHL
jgi:hypothetical protein